MSNDDTWSTFHDDLVRPVEKRAEQARLKAISAGPSARTAGVDWDGNQGEIRTGPLSQLPASDDWQTDLLREKGFNPDEVEIVGSTRFSSWEVPNYGTMTAYRFRIQKRVTHRDFDFEELLQDIRKHKPSKVKPEPGDKAFVVCSGDVQLGKIGSKETIDRFLASLSSGPARLKELRRLGRSIGPVFLPWLGDCVEGVQGHYPNQAFSVEMSITEQIRVLRRLAWQQVKTYAPLTSRLVVPVVPGNHDEAQRVGGKQITNNSDSYANDMASYLYDLVSENPAAYGHVEIVVPERDSLVLTQDMCGTLVGMAHGHQFGSAGPEKWWAGQAHGCQPIGESTLLLAGHLHHLHIRKQGVKSFVQIPALDSGSQWYADRTGMDSPPGIVTFVTGNGAWSDLAIL